MSVARAVRLDPPVDSARDHSLGEDGAEITLVEYGSYACPSCHAVHEVVADLRDRFGERLRYVFRHRPVPYNEEARRAAELAEYASETTGDFWQAHDALMKRGPGLGAKDLDQIATQLELPTLNGSNDADRVAARAKVDEDVQSAERSGVLITPTFFINGRRYEGPWDENSLAEAMLGTLGHRLHTTALDFVRWGPSAGFLLLLMTVLALVCANSRIGPSFATLWQAPAGIQLGERGLHLSLLDWINHGLLSVFSSSLASRLNGNSPSVISPRFDPVPCRLPGPLAESRCQSLSIC